MTKLQHLINHITLGETIFLLIVLALVLAIIIRYMIILFNMISNEDFVEWEETKLED